jgi:hypothetical protein
MLQTGSILCFDKMVEEGIEPVMLQSWFNIGKQ